MRMKQSWFWLVLIFLVGSICFGAGKVDYSKQGVCVLADTAVFAEPNQKSKYLAALSVGETVGIEGNPIPDPKDPNLKFIKVKLSDGKVGFASTWCIIQHAYVAVVHRTAGIYKRPDLLAQTDKSFEMLDIVAIDEEKDDWIHATGENQAKIGWMERTAVRKAKEDIVTAALLRKAIKGKEKTLTSIDMELIVAKLPYPTNYFATKMLQKYQNTPDPNQSQPSGSPSIDTNQPEATPQ